MDLGLPVTVALAVVAVAASSTYTVLERLDLPRPPTGDETLTTGAAIVVGTLLAAAMAEEAGERYHRLVHRAGLRRLKRPVFGGVRPLDWPAVGSET